MPKPTITDALLTRRHKRLPDYSYKLAGSQFGLDFVTATDDLPPPDESRMCCWVLSSSVAFTQNDPPHQAVLDAGHSRYLFVGVSGGGQILDLGGLMVGEYCVGMTPPLQVCTVNQFVLVVLLGCAPTEVFKAIVTAIPVGEMATLHSLGARTDKGEQHQLVDVVPFAFSLAVAQRHTPVAAEGPAFDLMPVIQSSPPAVQATPHCTVGADLVVWKAEKGKRLVANRHCSHLPKWSLVNQMGQAAGNTAFRVYSPSPCYSRDARGWGNA